MRLPVISIDEVVSRQLCTGCGACSYVEPERFRMGDADEFGRRPFHVEQPAPETGEALSICPGIKLDLQFDRKSKTYVQELVKGWGPVIEVWEGYAASPDIRFRGSSGGVATALATFCLERKGFAGVLHTGSRDELPILNKSVFSKTADELVRQTGSRYAPASPCDSLQLIEDAEAPCVFIGKPCDVAAVQQTTSIRPKLKANLGLAIAFFCAGTPSTQGTRELLKKMGVDDLSRVKELRYRGRGWPGMFHVRWDDEQGVERTAEMTYAESWDFLQRYRQWRCYICPDHTGEFADIAVGDPWYREIQPNDPGRSLIVPRTPRGVALLHEAHAAGYIVLEKNDITMLPRSQPNLTGARGSIWGRMMSMRLYGAPTPKLRGFYTFKAWLKLGLKEKVRSFSGTFKRIRRRKLSRPISVVETPCKELDQKVD